MRTTTNTEEVKLSEKERKANNSNLSRMAEVASGVHKKGVCIAIKSISRAELFFEVLSHGFASLHTIYSATIVIAPLSLAL